MRMHYIQWGWGVDFVLHRFENQAYILAAKDKLVVAQQAFETHKAIKRWKRALDGSEDPQERFDLLDNIAEALA